MAMIIIHANFFKSTTKKWDVIHKDAIHGTHAYILYIYLPQAWGQKEMIGAPNGQLGIWRQEVKEMLKVCSLFCAVFGTEW